MNAFAATEADDPDVDLYGEQMSIHSGDKIGGSSDKTAHGEKGDDLKGEREEKQEERSDEKGGSEKGEAEQREEKPDGSGGAEPLVEPLGIHFHLQVSSNLGTTELEFMIILDHAQKAPRLVHFSSKSQDSSSTFQLLHDIASDYARPQTVENVFLCYQSNGLPLFFHPQNSLEIIRLHRPREIVVLTAPWNSEDLFGEHEEVDADNPRFDVEGKKSHPRRTLLN
jgi:hypothetical protein